jgi:DNA polymerase III delta prime subunit
MLSLHLWEKFYNSFDEYILLIPSYNNIIKQLINNNIENSSNILTYGMTGFPQMLIIEYAISKIVNTTFPIKKRTLLWNSLPYIETDYYFEIDMKHPEFPKEIQQTVDFLVGIIKNKCIYLSRHIFILKNIDVIHHNNSQAFRVILERFYGTVMFIATTNKLNMIEAPILSRMILFRIPLPTEEEQKNILYKLTENKNFRYIDRNLIKNIFFNEEQIKKVNKSIPTLLYPPLQDFIDKSYNKEDIRKFSYKLYQHSITIPDIIIDLLKFIPDENIYDFIKEAANTEYMSCKADQSKICFFIEYILYLFIKFRCFNPV